MIELYHTMYLLWHLDVSIWPVHASEARTLGQGAKHG